MPKYVGLLVLAISILSTACSKTQEGQRAPAGTDYSTRVGWLHGNCLAIMNAGLSTGTPITVVQPNQPQLVSSATVASRASSGKECTALLEDRRQVNLGSGYTFYRVNSDTDINLGIAMLGKLKNIDDYAFDYCNTREGMSFSLKSSNKPSGAELWRGYYYLGYESEATCEKK